MYVEKEFCHKFRESSLHINNFHMWNMLFQKFRWNYNEKIRKYFCFLIFPLIPDNWYERILLRLYVAAKNALVNFFIVLNVAVYNVERGRLQVERNFKCSEKAIFLSRLGFVHKKSKVNALVNHQTCTFLCKNSYINQYFYFLNSKNPSRRTWNI